VLVHPGATDAQLGREGRGIHETARCRWRVVAAAYQLGKTRRHGLHERSVGEDDCIEVGWLRWLVTAHAVTDRNARCAANENAPYTG